MKYVPTDLIEVMYHHESVGALALDINSGFYAFEYDPEFSKSGIELSPLTMPLSRNEPVVFPYLPEATYHKLPPFIADSLPDTFGNALIDVWMARNDIEKSSLTVLDRLAYIGRRGMGALEFKPMIKLGDRRPTAIEMNDLVTTARKAVNVDLAGDVRGVTDSAIRQLISVGTSAGGARAKAVIGFDPVKEKFLSGQFDLPENYEHWMIKFDLPEQEGANSIREYGRIEYAYYLMAKECGINMTESRLAVIDDRAHFMTKRFDRSGNEKIHMQSLCAMSELDYNMRAVHDYIQYFNTINELDLGYNAVDQAFARMAFNIVMHNNDDHSKNHGFLFHNGLWQLSPAYDLTFASDPGNKWLNQHLMGVNGKFADINDEDMLEVGHKFYVKNPETILRDIRKVAGFWPDFAGESGLSASETKRVGNLLL